MKKLLILIPFLVFADVDPFSAGLKSGYGLTEDEKAILQNRKEIKSLEKNLKNLTSKIEDIQNKNSLKFVEYDQDISSIKERISVFNSLIDEIDGIRSDLIKSKKNYRDLNESVKNIEINISSLHNDLNSLKNRVSILEESVSQIVDIQNKNFNTLKKSVKDILEQIKGISKNSTISRKDAFYLGRQYFFDGKLDKAKELFTYSYNKGFLRATSSYYLGEIEFKRHHYKEALAFYKRSVSIYPKKTSFRERLLYHTGISFEKLGNKEAAKLTFEKLIKDYPSSKYADLAKKELAKLK